MTGQHAFIAWMMTPTVVGDMPVLNLSMRSGGPKDRESAPHSHMFEESQVAILQWSRSCVVAIRHATRHLISITAAVERSYTLRWMSHMIENHVRTSTALVRKPTFALLVQTHSLDTKILESAILLRDPDFRQMHEVAPDDLPCKVSNTTSSSHDSPLRSQFPSVVLTHSFQHVWVSQESVFGWGDRNAMQGFENHLVGEAQPTF
jgi:hypothetical protein